LVTLTSASPIRVTTAEVDPPLGVLLLPGVGSFKSTEATDALLDARLLACAAGKDAAVAMASMVIVLLAPFGSVLPPKEHVTTTGLPEPVQLARLPVDVKVPGKVKPVGRTSVTVTPVASLGPLLAATMV